MKEDHNKAAEQHENAAKSHRAAGLHPVRLTPA